MIRSLLIPAMLAFAAHAQTATPLPMNADTVTMGKLTAGQWVGQSPLVFKESGSPIIAISYKGLSIEKEGKRLLWIPVEGRASEVVEILVTALLNQAGDRIHYDDWRDYAKTLHPKYYTLGTSAEPWPCSDKDILLFTAKRIEATTVYCRDDSSKAVFKWTAETKEWRKQ